MEYVKVLQHNQTTGQLQMIKSIANKMRDSIFSAVLAVDAADSKTIFHHKTELESNYTRKLTATRCSVCKMLCVIV